MEIQREDKEGDEWGVQRDIYLLEFQKNNGWNQRAERKGSIDDSAKLRDERVGRSTDAKTWGSREIHWAFISETEERLS